MAKIRISGVVDDSIVDGPGLRYVIFTQGCPHHCPGCHNPATQDPKGGQTASVKEIFKQISSNPLISGVTFSGGDPFVQAKALIPLAKLIKSKNIELAAYTGFLYEQLASGSVPYARELLSYVDILIDGKFVLSQKSMSLKYKGSRNQRTIDVPTSLKQGQAVLSTDKRWTN